MNQYAKYIGQMSFTHTHTRTHTHTHTGLMALPGPPKWSVSNNTALVV